MSDHKWCSWCGKWVDHGSGSCPEMRAAVTHCAQPSGSALSSYHCPKCGKLKRKRDGSPHDCGPTKKQRMEELARDSAALWAVRQHLHDYLEPDHDVPEAAKRVLDDVTRLRAACIHARDFIQDVSTEDPDDVETMSAIERLSGELTAAIDGQNGKAD